MKGDSQQRLDDFAAKFPIGTEVIYRQFLGDEPTHTKIESKPMYLWCGTMVISINGNISSVNASKIELASEITG